MKKFNLIVLIGILAVALGAVTAQADLMITNGSFESGPDPGDSRITVSAGDNTTISGWSVTAGQVDIIGNNVLLASNGKWFMEMAGDVPGAMSTSFATTIGVQYKITFDLAGDFWAGAPGPFRLDVSAAGTTQTYLVSDKPPDWSPSNVGWTPETFLFTAQNDTTTLVFQEVIVPGANEAYGNPNYFAGHGAFVDNVKGSAVPVPASVLLLGSGLLGLVGWRRFRKS